MKNDYIIELQKLLSDEEFDKFLIRLMSQNFCYKQRIEKAIEYLENNWYGKNTRDIKHIISLGDWRLDLLDILRGEDNE